MKIVDFTKYSVVTDITKKMLNNQCSWLGHKVLYLDQMLKHNEQAVNYCGEKRVLPFYNTLLSAGTKLPQ